MDAMNKGLTYELTYKDVVDIMKIIDESVCQELHLEIGDFKLDLVKGPPGPRANTQGNAGEAGGKVHAANQAGAVQAAAVRNVDIAPGKKAELPEAVVAQRKVSKTLHPSRSSHRWRVFFIAHPRPAPLPL